MYTHNTHGTLTTPNIHTQVSFGKILGRLRMHDLRGQQEGNSGLPAYCNRCGGRSSTR